MNEDLSKLLKVPGATYIAQKNSKFIYTKKFIRNICKNLCIASENYKPEKSVESISVFLKSAEKMNRILYSEISNYIFSMNSYNLGIFGTNIEKLLLYVTDNKNNISSEIEEIVIRIYDHFQLVQHQIKNITKIYEDNFTINIENTKESLTKENRERLQSIEKDYISILGIFSSVILAFVGGMTFSTSVLENISKASIYRMTFIVLIIGFVFYNIIFMMFEFIRKISNISYHKGILSFIIVNVVLVSGMIFTSVAYKYNFFAREENITEKINKTPIENQTTVEMESNVTIAEIYNR